MEDKFLEEQAEYDDYMFCDDLFDENDGECDEDRPYETIFGDSEESEEVRQKIQEQYRRMNINLPLLETHIRNSIVIEKLWGRVRFFNGKHYSLLSRDEFGRLCKAFLPKDILDKIRSVKVFYSLFQYVLFDFVSQDTVEPEHYWISFENLIVNAATGEVEKHSKKRKLPYTINADYNENETDSVYFDGLLDNMCDCDEESIRLVWEMLAYSMLYLTPKRAFFWLGTEPASGKSLLGAFIQRLFGTKNCSQIEANDIGKRFSMSQFAHKKINIGMESGGKLNKMDVVRLKELTGNPIISIEQKGLERVDFPNYSVLIFASNDPVDIGDSDMTDAFWERLKLIPCTKTCPLENRDPYLLEKIWDERNAIVTKAVKVAQELIANDFVFTEPKVAQQIKQQWRRSSEKPIVSFMKERIDFVSGDLKGTYFIPTEILYQEYLAHTGDNITKIAFSALFHKYAGSKAVKGKKKSQGFPSPMNGFYNVRIRSKEELANE